MRYGKCFVPRLNKVMYIKDIVFENGQSEARTILLRESTMLEKRKAECESVLHLLRRAGQHRTGSKAGGNRIYLFGIYWYAGSMPKRTALYEALQQPLIRLERTKPKLTV